MLKKLIKLLRRLLHGPTVQAVPQRIANIENEISKLKEMIDRLANDISGEAAWLINNAAERLDANDSLFDVSRREFHLSRYRFAAQYCKNMIVADIASGTGYGSSLLANDGGASYVVGIDVDDSAVRYAVRHYMSKTCQFVIADACDTGLQGGLHDIVVSFETIEHVVNDAELIREFYRILKPGGLLICSVPNQWPMKDTPHHLREYNKESFCDLLSDSFDLLSLYNQNSGAGPYNRGQMKGIAVSDDNNASSAECYIAVCRKGK